MREELDQRVLRYLKFYSFRMQQQLPEAEIARQLGAESPPALYQALQRDGFPVCPICGATPEGPGHCEPPVTKRKRKARQGGEAIELPRAREARDLFREATQALSKIVDPPAPPIDHNDVTFRQIVDSLDRLGDLEEFLQGERFVSASVYRPDPDDVIFRREDFTEEAWVEACEAHGEDPSTDVFLTDSVGVSPQGAKQTPAEILVKLIGAYVLTGLPLDPLLEKLHPEPEEVDRDQLRAFIYGRTTEGGRHTEGMMDKVRQIARVVRGGTVRKGPPTEELSRKDLQAAWEIASWRSQGYADEDIHCEYCGGGDLRPV
jgi:hypothetical protein